MELLSNRIGLLKKQIAEVEEALKLQQDPPPYKIDESGYPALDAVRLTLAKSSTAAEHQQLVAQIENQLASQRKELANLETELATKQQAVAALKAEQAQALAVVQQAESAWLEASKNLIGLTQEIAEAADGVSDHQPVVFAGGLLEIDRRPAFKLAENGALHFGSQPSGLLQSVPSGWGGRSFKAIDCLRNAPVVEPTPQAPSVEPEPAADTQELEQAEEVLRRILAGDIQNFDQVELIPG